MILVRLGGCDQTTIGQVMVQMHFVILPWVINLIILIGISLYEGIYKEWYEQLV
jgi:hypothetical protein